MELYTVENINDREYKLLDGVEGSHTVAIRESSTMDSRLKKYKKEVDMAKREAQLELIREAEDLGADAIIGVRYEVTTITNTLESINEYSKERDSLTYILAYGTAIKYTD